MLEYLRRLGERSIDPLDKGVGKSAEGWLIAREGKDIPFPSVATPVSNDVTVIEARSVLKTLEISFEIPTVSEDLYLKTREALGKKGYTFVVAIEPLSIGQLAASDTAGSRFGYVNGSEDMRGIVPLQMEVAINPNNLRIKNSNSKSTDTQIEMIKEEEAGLKGKLPQEVRDLISMRIQNASVLAQLDNTYQQETGEVLFTNWFGRTDDRTAPGHVAGVGRDDPTDGLGVLDWRRGLGYGLVFAVSLVVLPRKLAV